jgi:hypothetical protein
MPKFTTWSFHLEFTVNRVALWCVLSECLVPLPILILQTSLQSFLDHPLIGAILSLLTAALNSNLKDSNACTFAQETSLLLLDYLIYPFQEHSVWNVGRLCNRVKFLFLYSYAWRHRKLNSTPNIFVILHVFPYIAVMRAYVCVCVCVCARARVRVCVCVCVIVLQVSEGGLLNTYLPFFSLADNKIILFVAFYYPF